jgi:hypothetical protein
MATRTALALAMLGFVGCGSHGSGGTGQISSSIHLSSPSFTLMPGDEVFKCWYTSIDSSVDLASVRMHSTMTPGSHHFIVYTTKTPLRPDGTFEDCGDNSGGGLSNTPVWLYATQDPDHELDMPDGTALPLAAKQPLYFNMHYINATPAPLTVQVTLDVDSTTSTSYQRVGAFITYNTQISIPPGGTQTVSGDCDVPMGARFFTMSTHSHKRTTEALAEKNVGGVNQMLVDTKDWEHATITNWASPDFLEFGPNDQLHYQCSYQNDTANTIKEGESAEKNEMCMAVGYYFPATGDTLCLNSSTFSF